MSVEFLEIEQAFWDWVNKGCPGKSSNARGKWMREHQGEFEYDGTKWTRSASPMRSNSGKTVVHWTIGFKGEDGRIVHNLDISPPVKNRRNDPDRNWGLPE